MERITKLSLELKLERSDESGAIRPYSLGPMLQSVLMEHVDSEYASFLHSIPFNPYSQCCVRGENGGYVWKINALTNESSIRLAEPASTIESITLRNLGLTFSIGARKQESFGTDHLVDCLGSDSRQTFRIRFLTPTAFKSKRQFVIVPDVRLLFQNLLMRYNHCYSGEKEVDQETLDYITEHVRITSYNLKSCYFPRTMSKSDKIPAFVGGLTLYVSGPQSIRGLVAMLLTFGEASGVGIKTSMGMGGICLFPDHGVKRTAKE